MAPVDHHQNNVIPLRNPTVIAREKARAEKRLAEEALDVNGEKFDGLLMQAANSALSSGSHIFAPMREALAAAERAYQDAKERLQMATTLFGRQLDVLDQAKSEHDVFVRTVKAESETNFDHQRDLIQAKQIGNEILSAKKHLRLLSERHRMRMNILRAENPLAWALFKNKEVAGVNRDRAFLRKITGKVADWLRTTKKFNKATVAITRMNGQIEDAAQNLARLGISLNAVHDDIFRVRNENLLRISKSHKRVETAQMGFSTAQSLQETVARELSICNQTLASLKDWDHPVAKEALDQFTDIVMTASRTGANIEAVAFLMGSKQLADNLIADIKRWDLAQYDLIAELHYCEEAETIAETWPLNASGVF